LRALASSSTQEDAYNGYGGLLNAVGRDHSGTYYPVVVPAIPFIGEVVEQGGQYARRYALEALTDIVLSFEPEPGFETIFEGGRAIELREAVRAAGIRLAPILRLAAVRFDNEPIAQRLAQDLLNQLTP
jgi:hypothetical protein